jgi:hypothetical protein
VFHPKTRRNKFGSFFFFVRRRRTKFLFFFLRAGPFFFPFENLPISCIRQYGQQQHGPATYNLFIVSLVDIIFHFISGKSMRRRPSPYMFHSQGIPKANCVHCLVLYISPSFYFLQSQRTQKPPLPARNGPSMIRVVHSMNMNVIQSRICFPIFSR